MNSLQRKEEIIDTAYRLFQEKGFDNVSVSDICHACKITKPTFYKYIASKEELLVYFYDGLIELAVEDLISRKDDADYLDQARDCLTSSVEKSIELGHDIYSRYLQYILHNHIPTRRYNSPATPLVKAALKKAQETGQIKSTADIDDLFLDCRNLCLGLSCQWCFGPGDFDLLEAVKEGQEAILRPDYEVIEKMKPKKEPE